MATTETQLAVANNSLEASSDKSRDVTDFITASCEPKAQVLQTNSVTEDEEILAEKEEACDSADKMQRESENSKITNCIANSESPSSSLIRIAESANLNSTVESDDPKDKFVENDLQSEIFDNRTSKSIAGDVGKGDDDSIPRHSSTSASPSKDSINGEEEPLSNLKRLKNLVDTDSEDEEIFDSFNRKKSSPGRKSCKSRSSSPDSVCLLPSKSSEKAKPIRKSNRLMSSDSEDEKEEITDQRDLKKKSNKISDLIDSDSEEENSIHDRYGRSSDEGKPREIPNAAKEDAKPEKQKKRTKSARAAKEEAMREIRSETQRMLRETEVYLPYHKPRQRTLQEFLNRRKELPVLPKTLSCAAKMKLSGDIVGKILEKKEKEAELFYKASSDSDNESTAQTESAIPCVKLKPIIAENGIENAIEETQKLAKIDLRNSQAIKEPIQQGDKSIGAPRKLFIDLDNGDEAVDSASPVVEDRFEDSAKENQDFNLKRKEFKLGLKDASVPRKLFGIIDGEIEENQEIPETNDSQTKVIGKLNSSNEMEAIDIPEGSIEHRNESMEEEASASFELKISEDPFEMMNDFKTSEDSVIPKTSTQLFETITETPFINHSKISESNDKMETDLGVTSGSSASQDESKSKNIHPSLLKSNDEDSRDKNEPIGHVYGLPLPEFDEDKLNKKKMRILPEIMKLAPKLQGSPDMVIELSPPKKGVKQLIKRLMDHSAPKKNQDSSPGVTVLHTEQTASGLKVTNQVLPYRIPMNEKNDDPELSKPGAKLIRLKEDLKQQMAMQRNKEWEQKELEIKSSEADEVFEDERSDCGMEEDENVEEEEDEDQTDADESELDECDFSVKKTKNKCNKNPFVDGEAEVSEDEELEEEEDDEDLSEEEDQEIGDSNDGLKKKSETPKLKRITRAFEDDDSDDNELKETTNDADHHELKRMETDADMFATNNNSDENSLSSTEGDLPVYQQQREGRSQSCATPSVANNSLSIVSPITQLTAFNTGMESASQDLRSTENNSQFMAPFSVGTTPVELKSYRECDPEKREKLPKKLFDDAKETPTDNELMNLCSGQFFDNHRDNKELDGFMNADRNTTVTDAELLDLCSGSFKTQLPNVEKLGASLSSPIKHWEKESQRSDKISSTGKIVFSSDDEDDSRVKNSDDKILKKKVKKLELSDDEEENDNASLSDFDEKENEEEKFFDYDSEENEIVVPKKDIHKVAARFLDEEAELSESEWGSADEDERDLDKLDLEEGDLEDIDQDQVKKQLEKIHMRQVLDEDQREVRILQELLLEDGELHSENPGRQRRFKWRNVDELGEADGAPLHNVDDDSVSLNPIEAESELAWRKQRFEREQFLKEQREKEAAADIDEEKEDSQLFQLGMKALRKNKNNKNPDKNPSQFISVDKSQSSIIRHTVADLFASPGQGKKTLALQNAIHRGSFLARGEESLAKLSVITRQNSDQAIIRTKNSRNFVFAHVSPAIEASVDEEQFDGGENTNSMNAKVKKRKPAFNLTPSTSKKRKKEFEQSNTRNKLFN